MDEEHLRSRLEAEFSPQPAVLEQVVRQANRLDQSGQFEKDADKALTAELLVGRLKTADRPLKASWNWWIGSLDAFEGGYRKYQL